MATTPKTLKFVTGNANKLREVRAILSPQIQPPRDDVTNDEDYPWSPGAEGIEIKPIYSGPTYLSCSRKEVPRACIAESSLENCSGLMVSVPELIAEIAKDRYEENEQFVPEAPTVESIAKYYESEDPLASIEGLKEVSEVKASGNAWSSRNRAIAEQFPDPVRFSDLGSTSGDKKNVVALPCLGPVVTHSERYDPLVLMRRPRTKQTSNLNRNLFKNFKYHRVPLSAVRKIIDGGDV